MPELDPSHTMQVGMGFFASKALLSAVELGLFTELAKQPMTALEIARSLGLHPRAVPDFPDALVALKFLERTGDGPDGLYSNTPESAAFLDRNSPNYIGGILEMANARLYGFWTDLTEALRTGAPQNETKHSGEPMFAKLYEAPERLEQFMNAMSGVRLETSRHSLRSLISRSTRPSAMSAGRLGNCPAWSPQHTRTCVVPALISLRSYR